MQAFQSGGRGDGEGGEEGWLGTAAPGAEENSDRSIIDGPAMNICSSIQKGECLLRDLL